MMDYIKRLETNVLILAKAKKESVEFKNTIIIIVGLAIRIKQIIQT